MAIKFIINRTILRFLLPSIIVLIIILINIILFWPQNNLKSSIKIFINPGSSSTKISNILAQKEVISNTNTFIWAAKLMNKEKKIPTGAYKLEKTFNNYEIIKKLANGKPEVKEIKILEGWNLRLIANELNKKLDFRIEHLNELFKDKSFLKTNKIESNSLEGYLFPDTYKVFEGDNVRSVLSLLIKTHNRFWTKTNINRAKELKLSIHEIVTLASIIEGEAIYDSERSKISGVYHNRLKLGMKLQADPTIQYIIKDSPRRLLNKDLRIKSPYNTYMYKGLPPGPINSPGRNSLLAALYPEKNDFIFFVARGDGYHTFTTNERDHNLEKRKLQKLRKKLKKKRYNG